MMKQLFLFLICMGQILADDSLPIPCIDATPLCVIEQRYDDLVEQITETITRDCDFAVQQINQFNLTPFIINQPGLYCVGSDLTITATQGSAIIINSDNVILDLNDKTIRGFGLVNGIRVNGRASVIIRNGRIVNAGLNGIFIGPTASIGPIASNGNTPRNIVVSDMVCFNTGTAITLANSSNAVLLRCAALNSTINSFFINQSNNVGIIFCAANNNVRGFTLSNNTSVLMSNCTANNNRTEGFSQTSGFFTQYNNCTANQNLTGFLVNNTTIFTQSLSSIFTQCVACGNRENGFTIRGNQHSLEHCFSHDNVTNGFFINGRSHTILGCEAKNNGANGFILASATTTSVTATTCHVRDNIAIGNTTGFSNAGTNNRIYGNYANNNLLNGAINNYVGITNVAISPTATTPINHTANISE